jgi:hypothetical protein
MATSDEAVLKATGKNWKDWFSILDKAKKETHREKASFIFDNYFSKHKSGGWWSQGITVEYERARGLRKVNQVSDGFRVTINKTVDGTIKDLENKWEEILKLPEVKKKNLEKIPSKTKRAMVRYKYKDGEVFVYFDEKGDGKAKIMVEPAKLPKKSLVETERKFWKKILGKITI